MASRQNKPTLIVPKRVLGGVQLTLGVTLLGAMIHLPAAIAATVLAVTGLFTPATDFGRYAAAGLLVLGYLSAIACAAAGAKRARFAPSGLDYFTMPAYWPLQTLAMIKALAELPGRAHVWRKTDHGVSAAARAPPE